MLVNKPQFSAVATQLQQWFDEQLQGREGVLVSHNSAVDVQFLLCEHLRAKMPLHPQIKSCLCTMATIKRFSSIKYRKVAPADWTVLTKKGMPSMGVKPCATYALSKRQPPEDFEHACGNHHDADADTRAVAVILFDQVQFPRTGLHQCVFKSKRK